MSRNLAIVMMMVAALFAAGCALPQESIDALKQGRDAMLQSFPDWSAMDQSTRETTRKAMSDGCGQARDALRQASEALGCPV
ncbi:MAG TPA: hypothetical protein VM261_27910 [Kofleriaceae bacterium]|nr:hypothetical protein [Kofleriaceae bacterium]